MINTLPNNLADISVRENAYITNNPYVIAIVYQSPFSRVHLAHQTVPQIRGNVSRHSDEAEQLSLPQLMMWKQSAV